MVYDLDEVMAAAPTEVTELPPPAPKPEPVSLPAPSGKGRYWKSLRLRVLISVVLCGLILTLNLWWPQAAELLRDQAGNGEIGPVQSAAQTLVTDVLSGEPIPEAIAAFCQEVVYAQD